jgi:hypothetical protein
MRALVVACAAAVLLAALFAAAGDDHDPMQTAPGIVLGEGLIFSSDDGDPVDVCFTRETQTKGCMNVGGFFYGSTISCFDLDGAEGSYVVVSATDGKPPIVVGVMPNGAIGATVRAGEAQVQADTRGRWFLASLEPDTRNLAIVSVDFDGR